MLQKLKASGYKEMNCADAHEMGRAHEKEPRWARLHELTRGVTVRITIPHAAAK